MRSSGDKVSEFLGVYIGDNHLDDQKHKPTYRKDDYARACKDELRESLDIARRHKADYAVLLGDLFNRIKPDDDILNSAIEILQEPRDFPVYAIIGNHDVSNSPQRYRESALYSVELSGAIKVVDEAPEFNLGFVHYANDAATQLKEGSIKDRTHLIQAVHCSVTLGPFHGDYVELNDVQTNPACRLLVAGHIHSPMRRRRQDGLIFINPGSLARRKVSPENLGRSPFVLLVKHTLSEIIETQDIPLVCCEPSDDIFHIAKAKAKKTRENTQKSYVKGLEELSGWVFDDEPLYESLEQSAVLKGLEKEVIDIVLQMVKEVDEEIGTNE